MSKSNHAPNNLLDSTIKKAISAIPDSAHYLIALSGGLDSMALLQFALPELLFRISKLDQKTKNISGVEVIHVHHGLSVYADDWAEHCRLACETLGVPCYVERVLVNNEGQGLEAAAREARYSVFQRYMRPGSVLLQGHHLNDQAETVLMRLMRGSGPEGLAGIPKQRALGEGLVYRPWLELPRALLEAEAERRDISWVEDDSNDDRQFDRNYIRHEVMPVLAKRWDGCLNDLSRVASRAEETQDFLKSWCQGQEASLFSEGDAGDRALSLSGLLAYSKKEQRLLVRYWFDLLGVRHPSEKIFNRLWAEVIYTAEDAHPEIRWGQHVIRRYNGCLFLLRSSDLGDCFYQYAIDLDSVVLPVSVMTPVGELTIDVVSDSLSSDDLVQDVAVSVYLISMPKEGELLTVKSRSGGESMCVSNHEHSTSLKKLYQSQKVHPWLRSQLPLLYYGDRLVFSAVGIIAREVGNGLAETHALKVSFNKSRVNSLKNAK